MAASSAPARRLYVDCERFAVGELRGICESAFAGTALGIFLGKAANEARKQSFHARAQSGPFPMSFLFVHFTTSSVTLTDGRLSRKVRVVAEGEAILDGSKSLSGRSLAVLLAPTVHTFQRKYGRMFLRLLKPSSHKLVDSVQSPQKFKAWVGVLDWVTPSSPSDHVPFANKQWSNMSESQLLKAWELKVSMLHAELGASAVSVTTFRCAPLSRTSCVFSALVIQSNGEATAVSTTVVHIALHELLP